MKKKLIKSAALILSVLMLAGVCVSCSSNNRKIATDGGKNSISLAMYSLMTSLMKGNQAYYIQQNYGSYNSPDFWSTIVDTEKQITYKDYFSYVVEEKVRTYLAALALFDEEGLSLSKNEIAEIDRLMNDFVEVDGEGSKNKLNSILSSFGANYDTLRDYKIVNAKIAKLSEHLYGKDASLIAYNVKQEYFADNYVAFRQILLPKYEYVYETDKFGDSVYYKLDADGKILLQTNAKGEKYEAVAYDTVNGVTIDGENGIDANGNKIYFRAEDGEDGSVHIAYDTSKGARKYVIGTDGYPKTRKLNDNEVEALKAQAKDIVSSAIAGDESDFIKLAALYGNKNGDLNEKDIGDICYLDKNNSYAGSADVDGKLLDRIADALESMQTGDVKEYESDQGIHILIRCELKEGAFADRNYSDWFVDPNKVGDFNTKLVDYLFVKRLEPYLEKVTFDKEMAEKEVDISKIAPNYDYY